MSRVRGALRGGKGTAVAAAVGALARLIFRSETVATNKTVQEHKWLPGAAAVVGGHFLQRKHQSAGIALAAAGGMVIGDFIADEMDEKEPPEEPETAAVYDPVFLGGSAPMLPYPTYYQPYDAGNIYASAPEAACAGCRNDAGNIYESAPDAGAVYGRRSELDDLMRRPIV